MSNDYLGLFDRQINTIITNNPGCEIQKLFETYQALGDDKDGFVAALIVQLCIVRALKKRTTRPSNVKQESCDGGHNA